MSDDFVTGLRLLSECIRKDIEAFEDVTGRTIESVGFVWVDGRPLADGMGPLTERRVSLKLAGPEDEKKACTPKVNIQDKVMSVVIPARETHEGIDWVLVLIKTTCPICGGPRGVPSFGVSYDGSRRLKCSVWENPCGHVDKYSAVRKEAAENGLNN